MASEPTEHIAETLLKRAHSPETASTIFREKVKQRPLLLRPTSPDPDLNARSERQYERLQKAKEQRKSNKPKPLSAKQKRALSIHEIPKEQQKYAIYEPLHRMWCAYMREILGVSDGKRSYVDANSAGPVLVSADYHGALVEVVRSRCGRQQVVTVKDELKIMPKEHTVFRFEVPFERKENCGEVPKPLVFEIHGNQFEARAPDRANRKFRQHFDPDL
ncbi:hypothetical protein LTR29_003018 [Friedmanniomyces endolithicus]|nr:hypothetical protein LTR29_003018 [Friedmanniomyces endolithicus]